MTKHKQIVYCGLFYVGSLWLACSAPNSETECELIWQDEFNGQQLDLAKG